MITKILNTNFEEIKLKLTEKELEELKFELSGGKPYIQEYKTAEGKIITDLEIVSIIKS